MSSIAGEATADVTAGLATVPRFEDGCISLQELIHQMAESLANEIMSAETNQC